MFFLLFLNDCKENLYLNIGNYNFKEYLLLYVCYGIIVIIILLFFIFDFFRFIMMKFWVCFLLCFIVFVNVGICLFFIFILFFVVIIK